MGRGARLMSRRLGATVIAPPRNTVAPSIAATAATFTVTPGTWTGNPTITRQWYRGASAIAGQTGLTYTVAAADAGQNITCVETATNSGGVRTATSNTLNSNTGSVALALLGGSSVVKVMLDYGLGITLTGGAVSAWADQSGNANDFTQGTAGSRPTVDGTGVLFDGTDDYLECASSSFIAATDGRTTVVSAKMLAVPGSGTGQQIHLLKRGSTPIFDAVVFYNIATFKNFNVTGALAASTHTNVGSNPAFDTNMHDYVATYNAGTSTSAASYTGAIDGADETMGTDTGLTGAAATNRMTIGAFVTNTPTIFNPFNGYIRRIAVTAQASGAVLTATQIAILRGWANA